MKNFLTIPNVISFFRLLLIPLFVISYFKDSIGISIAIILISGLSDIVDGFIARKFNMVSDLGKVLDPIADKLTQAVVLLCLTINHAAILPMFAVLFVKELITMFVAVYLLSSGTKPISSKWFGKLSTVVIFLAIFYTLIVDIYGAPIIPLYILVAAYIICMFVSVMGYFKLFSKQVKGEIKNDETV